MQERGFALVERLADLTGEYGMGEQVFAFGADYMVLKHLKQVNPEFHIGLIVPFVPADPVKLMEEMDAMVYLSYVYNMTPKIVEDLHRAGYFVDGAILREENGRGWRGNWGWICMRATGRSWKRGRRPERM